jgi:hypothetical protein
MFEGMPISVRSIGAAEAESCGPGFAARGVDNGAGAPCPFGSGGGTERGRFPARAWLGSKADLLGGSLNTDLSAVA